MCLFLLGKAEQQFNIKLLVNTYEVTGSSPEEINAEVNLALERVHAMTQNVQVAATRQHVRLQFDVEGTRKEQDGSAAGAAEIVRARKRRAVGPGANGMTPPDAMIPFVKASACGNDFLIVDGSYVPADIAGFSKRLCDRHDGVGADGVEWLFPARDADIRARLFNADGSEAEISGNGTRCVAAYLCSEQTPAESPSKAKKHSRSGPERGSRFARSSPAANPGMSSKSKWGSPG